MFLIFRKDSLNSITEAKLFRIEFMRRHIRLNRPDSKSSQNNCHFILKWPSVRSALCSFSQTEPAISRKAAHNPVRGFLKPVPIISEPLPRTLIPDSERHR
jgi:hypothetical protein